MLPTITSEVVRAKPVAYIAGAIVRAISIMTVLFTTIIIH